MLIPNNPTQQKGYALEFANPTYDIAFKKLFAHQENEEIIIDLLNTFFDFTGDKEIKKIKILNSENIENNLLSEFKHSGKITKVDAKYEYFTPVYEGKDRLGGRIIFEMQRANPKNFMSRLLYYTSDSHVFLVNHNKNLGNLKYDIPPIYSLVIYTTKVGSSNENTFLINENDRIENCLATTILDDNKIINEGKSFCKIFELNKFRKYFKRENNSIKETKYDLFTQNLCYPNNYSAFKKRAILQNNIEKKIAWLKFFSYCSERTSIPENINNSLKNSYGLMNISEWQKKEQEQYKKLQEEVEDYELFLNEEKKEAKMQGIRIGKLEGEKRGKLEGEIGKVKFLKKYNIAEYDIKDFKYLKSSHIKKILEKKNWQDLSNAQIFEKLQKGGHKII